MRCYVLAVSTTSQSEMLRERDEPRMAGDRLGQFWKAGASSPRFKRAPLHPVRRPSQQVPVPQGQHLPRSRYSQASPSPSDRGLAAALRSSSPAHQDEGPTAPWGGVHHLHIGLE